MKISTVASLVDGSKVTLTNGRGHEIISDLPKDMNGSDLGPMPTELTLMSLGGCMAALFSAIAQKSRVQFFKVDIELDATKGKKTIEQVVVKVKVKSESPEEKIKKVLDKTIAMCPVGILFEQADVDIDTTLILN